MSCHKLPNVNETFRKHFMVDYGSNFKIMFAMVGKVLSKQII